MSLAKIDEVVLYICSTTQTVDSHELCAWFDHKGIPYIKLDYQDVNQHPDVFAPLNTWWREDDNGVKQEPINEFPFVVYTEIHSDKPFHYLPKKYIKGKEAIMDQLPDLYKLGR